MVEADFEQDDVLDQVEFGDVAGLVEVEIE